MPHPVLESVFQIQNMRIMYGATFQTWSKTKHNILQKNSWRTEGESVLTCLFTNTKRKRESEKRVTRPSKSKSFSFLNLHPPDLQVIFPLSIWQQNNKNISLLYWLSSKCNIVPAFVPRVEDPAPGLETPRVCSAVPVDGWNLGKVSSAALGQLCPQCAPRTLGILTQSPVSHQLWWLETESHPTSPSSGSFNHEFFLQGC